MCAVPRSVPLHMFLPRPSQVVVPFPVRDVVETVLRVVPVPALFFSFLFFQGGDCCRMHPGGPGERFLCGCLLGTFPKSQEGSPSSFRRGGS